MAEQGAAVATSCLLSLQSTQSLLAPIEASKKIKYTCIAASQSYVALGANTGGVYCFHRNGYKFIRILANREGSVSQVRFSSAENNLAVVSGGGYVGLWELNPQEHGVSKRLHVCSLLKDTTVRDMVWDSKGSRVFFGDDTGRVAVTYLPKQQKLFKKPDELVLQEKAPIVQLDLYQELLLVSTQTRCLIYKLVTKETLQVGTRPRDGPFGACFHRRWADRPPIVFSARPGGRLWQADVEGTVVSTLKLKDAVSIAPSPVLGVGFSPEYAHSSHTTLTPSLNFPHLFLLHNLYMVGWVNNFLFLFEPASYRLAAWTNALGSILDLYCDGRQLFVLYEGVGCVGVSVVSFVSLETCVQWLVKLELTEQTVKVLETHCVEVSQQMDSPDGMLYSNVRTVLRGLSDATPPEPLLSLKTRLTELEEKFGHVQGIVENSSINRNIEEPAKLENGFETVDLMAYSEEQSQADHVSVDTPSIDHMTSDVTLDVTPHVTSHVISDETPHVTSHVTPHVTPHVTSNVTSDETSEEISANGPRDLSADFPLTFTISDEPEPVLDSTLVPTDHPDNLDSTLAPDDLGDPLTASSHTFLPQEDGSDQNKEEPPTSSKEDTPSSLPTASSLPTSTAAPLPAFPEESGRELPRQVTRSQSQTIPGRGVTQTGQSVEGTPEYGTSVLSSSHSLPRSASNPQSLENRFSLEQEAGHKRATPDFANRVAAALSSISPHDDQVVAVSVKSSSGSSKEGGKSKSKKKGSRKKKSASPAHASGRRLSTPDLSDSVSMTTSPSRSFSLVHIPEESLPFPEAGLPPTTPPHVIHQPSPPTHVSHTSSYQNSASSSMNVSPHTSHPHSPPPTDTVISSSEVVQNGFVPGYVDRTESLPESQGGGSLPESWSESSMFGGLQKPSTLLSKVKNIAKQGGVSLDSNKIQKPVKRMKELLSSLTNPPLLTSQDSQTSLYNNENFQSAPPPTSPPLELGEMVLSPTTPPPTVKETDSHVTLAPETIAFVQATNSTWQHLDDPDVLSSPVSMTTSLREWLSKLDNFRTHISTLLEEGPVEREATNRGQSVFLSPRYSELEPAAKQTVTSVASLCLEIGCYGDNLSPSEGVVEFILKYYPILDMKRVKNVLSQQEWDVRVNVWKHLAVSVYSGGTTLHEVCSDQNTEGYKLPAVMMRLYSESPEVMVEACVSHFPQLFPWEVAISCEISQSEGLNKSCDEHMMQSATYVDYLSRLAESRSDDLSTIFFEDSTLLIKSLRATLEEMTRGGGYSSLSVPVSRVLELLIDCCVSLRGEVVTCARDLCLSHRYWVGVVQLSVAMGDKRQALIVLLCLKDLSLFINQQKWANLLNSLDDWQLLLELISSADVHLKATPTSPTHTQSTSTEAESTALDKPVHPVAETPTSPSRPPPSLSPLVPLDETRPHEEPTPEGRGTSHPLPREGEVTPQTELTLSGILRLMIGALPPTMVIKLLSGNHGNRFGSTQSEQVHGVLSQLVQIHSNQRALAHSLLERVDQYLWSPRPSTIGPQLLTVQNSEKLTEQSEDHHTPLSVTSVTPLSEWLEDAATHWGVRTKPSSTCPVCRLSLLSPVSDLEPGLIALRCGHAFHKRCLPESACVECFAGNMRALAVGKTD